MTTVYPLSAARTLALYTQGLISANHLDEVPIPETINSMVEQVNYVQIDTLNLIQRAQYIVLWSRLGSYQPSDLDRLIYQAEDKQLFEGVHGVAAIIPLKHYRYQLPEFDRQRRALQEWVAGELEGQKISDLVDMVRGRIQREGGLRAADFEYHGSQRGSWWDWKPAKSTLEYLFLTGELMIARRVNFQRVYDLTERVLPEWVSTQPATPEEHARFWLEQGLLAVGICQLSQIGEYAYHKLRKIPNASLQAIVDQGLAVPVKVMLADGEVHEMVIHRARLEALEQVADGVIKAGRTTFLSFFDNLFWCRGRDMQLWGYKNIIESYNKAENRQYGYFCQSILHHDQIIGRFDPKMERKLGVLRLKALYLEEGVEPEEELVSDVAEAMRDFMKFHQAKELVIEKSQPEEFGERLLKVL